MVEVEVGPQLEGMAPSLPLQPAEWARIGVGVADDALRYEAERLRAVADRDLIDVADRVTARARHRHGVVVHPGSERVHFDEELEPFVAEEGEPRVQMRARFTGQRCFAEAGPS